MKVLVVGSSVVDIFTIIPSAHYTTADNHVSFTLGDKVPIDIKKLSLGGNGANVANGVRRLGHTVSFYTYLGADALSKDIEERLGKQGITIYSEQDEHQTGSVSFIFDFESDRIIFSHHQENVHSFSYTGTKPEYVFLSSIGKDWHEAYTKVLAYVKDNTIPFAFSPGVPQLEDQNEQFSQALSSCESIFVNREEAELILKHEQKEYSDIKSILEGLQSLGPKLVSITDGANGGYLIDTQKIAYHIDAIKEEQGDKTGAGDAYCSGFLAAYLSNYDVIDCMKWGVINAASVMKYTGAEDGLLTFEQLKNAHNKYMFLVAQRI